MLRSEPNDHDVWEAEKVKFNEEIERIRQNKSMYTQALETDIAQDKHDDGGGLTFADIKVSDIP